MNYRYQNVKITKNSQLGEQFYANNFYPNIPVSDNDTYVITVMGDRLDLLAFDYYGDVTLWWVIASANSLPGDSLYVEPGTQIRVPSNLMAAINQYNFVNSVR